MGGGGRTSRALRAAIRCGARWEDGREGKDDGALLAVVCDVTSVVIMATTTKVTGRIVVKSFTSMR